MAIKSVALSSGHGKYVRGAEGYLDEVNEARKVVETTAAYLRNAGAAVKTFHDNTSRDQNTNLNTIVNWHNQQEPHDLDVSVHFNAYQTTSKPMGTECLYKTQETLAKAVASEVAVAGEFINRGPKYRSDLKFLNATAAPAILVEVCFVDSKADHDLYLENYDDICLALAEGILGEAIDEGPRPPQPIEPPGPYDEPTIAKGDQGPHVQNVQEILGIVPADGEFGPVTDGGVKGFQAACGLLADGVVGPQTWDALNELNQRKTGGHVGLTKPQIAAITKIAKNSAIASYSWQDRGRAPVGYICGIALSFALALRWFEFGGTVVDDMAQADRDDPDNDALTWYRDEFASVWMYNNDDGVDTLRHLFVMLLGLGMRESSGRYCEGRDLSAANIDSDTAEAGLFQTSWNIHSCHDDLLPLLESFWDNPNGFLPTFQSDVAPDANDLDNFGSGDGARYQFMSKFAPTFHVFVTAIGLRYLRQHWGPINRKEVEIRQAADDMLFEVQAYVEDAM